MNKLAGHINEIKVSGALSEVIVTLKGNISLRVIVIENPDSVSYLNPGHPIEVIFKETEVILAKNDPQVSLMNKIETEIELIKKGELLSEITMRSEAGLIKAVVNSDAIEVLGLKVNDHVLAMIKQNEIMLAE